MKTLQQLIDGLTAERHARGDHRCADEIRRVVLERCERQGRVRASNGRQRPLYRREHLPPPTWTAQYTPATSTLAARDGRLTDGAARLLSLIRALAGKAGTIELTTRAYLAKMMPGPYGLPRCLKTIDRHLQALRRTGMIVTAKVVNAMGAIVGISVKITDLVPPAHERRDQRRAFEEAADQWRSIISNPFGLDRLRGRPPNPVLGSGVPWLRQVTRYSG